MATKKVKRFYDGGDASYGGETGGGANEPGTGGNISGGGYDGGDSISSSEISKTTGDEDGVKNTYDRVTLNQANTPVAGNFNNALGISRFNPDGSNYNNFYGYQNSQDAKDAYESFLAEQSMKFDRFAKGGIMDTKKLKYKDIYTEEMGNPPENNDMGSVTKPSKQGTGAGAGRGKQGGPTAKELADYSRKQNQKRLDDTVFREGKKLPKNDDMGSAYAKGGMARDKGKHKMPDGKMMKNSAMVKKYAKGGMVSSVSSRGDGMAVRGKTRGKLY